MRPIAELRMVPAEVRVAKFRWKNFSVTRPSASVT